MQHTFSTYEEAHAAGYTRTIGAKDISGKPWFGYQFESEDGKKSVTVYLTEEKNRMNQKGCCVAMFPPTNQ